MLRKSLIGACEFKVKESDRVIEAYASKWVRDEDGDMMALGAFKKTIQERRDRIIVLRGHDSDRIVGRPLELAEDSQGLYTKSTIARTPLGDETLVLAADKMLTGVSVGFDPIAGKTDFELIEGKRTRVRREVKLYEYSFVAFPAVEDARILGVKGRSEKSLADVADVLNMLEFMRSKLSDSQRLTDEELQLARTVLEAMQSTSTDLMALLEPASLASTTPTTEPPSAAVDETKGLSRLSELATAARLHNLTKELLTWNPN